MPRPPFSFTMTVLVRSCSVSRGASTSAGQRLHRKHARSRGSSGRRLRGEDAKVVLEGRVAAERPSFFIFASYAGHLASKRRRRPRARSGWRLILLGERHVVSLERPPRGVSDPCAWILAWLRVGGVRTAALPRTASWRESLASSHARAQCVCPPSSWTRKAAPPQAL